MFIFSDQFSTHSIAVALNLIQAVKNRARLFPVFQVSEGNMFVSTGRNSRDTQDHPVILQLIDSIRDVNVAGVKKLVEELNSRQEEYKLKPNWINIPYQETDDNPNNRGGFSFGKPRHGILSTAYSALDKLSTPSKRVVERNEDVMVFKVPQNNARQKALENRALEILIFLVESGADINKSDDISYSQTRVDESLLNLAIRNNDELLLRVVLKYSKECISRAPKESGSYYSFSNAIMPIHRVIEESNMRFLEIFIEEGVDVNSISTMKNFEDTYFGSFSFGATSREHAPPLLKRTSLLLALLHTQGSRTYDMLNLLLDNGANLNQYLEWTEVDENAIDYPDLDQAQHYTYYFFRGTILHYALRHGMEELVNFLLFAGADKAIPSYQLVYDAISQLRNQVEIVFPGVQELSFKFSPSIFKLFSKNLKQKFLTFNLCLDRIELEIPQDIRHSIMIFMAQQYYADKQLKFDSSQGVERKTVASGTAQKAPTFFTKKTANVLRNNTPLLFTLALNNNNDKDSNKPQATNTNESKNLTNSTAKVETSLNEWCVFNDVEKIVPHLLASEVVSLDQLMLFNSKSIKYLIKGSAWSPLLIAKFYNAWEKAKSNSSETKERHILSYL